MEKLHITNFAGIKNASVELNRINIFIGPQASGKSVCVKLFYFFKEILSDLLFTDDDEPISKTLIRKVHIANFERYFPRSTWGEAPFQIRYEYEQFWVEVNQSSYTLQILYSPYFDRLLSLARRTSKAIKDAEVTTPVTRQRHAPPSLFDVIYHKIREELGSTIMNVNTFIPAGRSFFSVMQRNVWRVINREGDFDPFIAQFGRAYERETGPKPTKDRPTNYKEIEEYVAKLVGGNHVRINGRDFVRMSEGRQIPIEASSSGQQEVLPLAITLASIAQSDTRAISTIIIEEPEAHLYPSAQRDLIHLFSLVVEAGRQGTSSSQYLITTHSPYILSALNNLMYAEQIVKASPDKKQLVTEILGNASLIDATDVKAYAFGNGVKSIMDLESGLVKASTLDGVSNELAKEFGHLVDIFFEDEDR